MPRPTPDWPPPEAERRLLADLAANHATAPNDVAVAYLEPLTAFLVRSRGVRPDLAATAAEDAILDFCRHPARYDPSRRSLAGYLWMAADGDLLNLLRREGRRREILVPDVELAAPARNNPPDGPDGPGGWDHPQLAAAVSALLPADQLTLDLMRDGERRTAVFAARLGLDHLSPVEQAVVVKRTKDRVLKQLQRAVGGGR